MPYETPHTTCHPTIAPGFRNRPRVERPVEHSSLYRLIFECCEQDIVARIEADLRIVSVGSRYPCLISDALPSHRSAAPANDQNNAHTIRKDANSNICTAKVIRSRDIAVLRLRPRFHVYYTPTYSSWLNQIEIWFNIITQRAIRRGTFRSVRDLVANIERFVKRYNRRAQPFVWTATADSILEKIERLCKAVAATGH